MSILSGPASLLGIGPDHGEYYKNNTLDNKGTKSLAEMLAAARGAGVNDAGKGLVNGGSLADALKSLSPDEVSALASSPVYGNLVASAQAQSDPMLAGIIGKGGSLEQALGQEHDLATQGFKLQPQDIEAYGQASGNIARMFGQNDQSLASALAARGLAAGGSGAGMASFTGSLGNKNEQLAAMQMQIANDRMNNTAKRLADTRNFINQTGHLGLDAENSKFGNNMAGANARTSLAHDLANNERADYGANEEARQKSMLSQQGAKVQNLGDAFSSGIYQGVEAGTGAGAAGIMGGKSNKKDVVAGNQAGGVAGGKSAASMLA